MKTYTQEEVDALLDRQTAITTNQILNNLKDFNYLKEFVLNLSEKERNKIIDLLVIKNLENVIYNFYKDGDFDQRKNNASYGSFQSRFETYLKEV